MTLDLKNTKQNKATQDTFTSRFIRPSRLSMTIVASMLISTQAIAKDSKVEVLVFENLNASAASESHSYEAPKRMKTGSSAWAIRATMLISSSARIQKS